MLIKKKLFYWNHNKVPTFGRHIKLSVFSFQYFWYKMLRNMQQKCMHKSITEITITGNNVKSIHILRKI